MGTTFTLLDFSSSPKEFKTPRKQSLPEKLLGNNLCVLILIKATFAICMSGDSLFSDRALISNASAWYKPFIVRSNEINELRFQVKVLRIRLGLPYTPPGYIGLCYLTRRLDNV